MTSRPDGFEQCEDTDNRLMERDTMLFELHKESGRIPWKQFTETPKLCKFGLLLKTSE